MAKILYITNRYRNYVAGIYAAMAEVCELKVFWTSPPAPNDNITALPPFLTDTAIFSKDQRVIGIKQPARFWQYHQAVRQQLKDVQAVICSSETWTTTAVYVAARRAQVPLILQVENWKNPLPRLAWTRQPLTKLHKLCNFYELQNADALLYYGTYSHDYLLERGLDPRKMFRFTKLYDFASQPTDTVWEEKLRSLVIPQRTFLYFGRITKYKGLQHLIRAFKTLPDNTRLLVIGGTTGPDGRPRATNENYLKECQQEAGDDSRIVFLGPAPATSAATIYRTGSIFVLANPDFYDGQESHETWGNALVEAASVGLPLIAAACVGSAPDIIEDGVSGFLVRGSGSDLEQQLRERMRQLLEQPDLQTHFATQARRLYRERFDLQANQTQFLNALRSVGVKI